MIYLITGENRPLIDSEKAMIISGFDSIPFTILPNRSSLDDFIYQLTTCDMFSAIKGIIVNEPQWIKKISKDDLNRLTHGLVMAKQFKLPIIIISTLVDKRLSAYKCLKTHGLIEKACPVFREWESQKIIDWMTCYYAKKEIKLQPNVIQLFINAFGCDIGILQQEINACLISILPRQHISIEDALNSSSNSVGVYHQLAMALKMGKLMEIASSIDQLIKLKEDAHKIVNQCLLQLNQLLPIILGMKHKYSAEKIADLMGKHPFFIKKQMEALRNNQLKVKYHLWVISLAEIDQLIKMGRLTSRQALIMFNNKIMHQI